MRVKKWIWIGFVLLMMIVGCEFVKRAVSPDYRLSSSVALFLILIMIGAYGLEVIWLKFRE